MIFQLGQVKVWAGPLIDQGFSIMEEVEGKIEDAARNGLPIHQDMLFEQMPTARSHKQRGRLLI